MGKILIVDDDAQLRTSFEKILRLEGYDTMTASSGEAGIQMVAQNRPGCVIMDVRLPGMDGLSAFTEMKKTDPRLPVIIMTAFGTTDIAIEATKLGAFDYVLKPFDVASVLSLISQALQAGRAMQEPVAVGGGPESPTGDAIIGASPAMQNIYKAIGRVAATDATVLIRGESGTGKELVARAIYQHSTRADKPFLIINCVAIPETLLESELFGYEKGAFTGAATRRVGKIERANRGSILLDEIGDMPINIQAKLLRLLEERKIERLGGREPIPVDVRIIAATNRNLEEAVAEGRFREDLYYRLNVVPLETPPLRGRGEDIALLARHFLARYASLFAKAVPEPDRAFLAALARYPWPGNVREFENAMEYLVNMLPEGVAPHEGLLPPKVRQALGADAAVPPVPAGSGEPGVEGQEAPQATILTLAEMEKQAIASGIARFGSGLKGKRTTAEALGISLATLYRKLKEYGLEK